MNLNILHRHLFDRRPGTYTSLLEHCDGGSPDAMLDSNARRGQMFEHKFVWHLLCDIARGLAFHHNLYARW